MTSSYETGPNEGPKPKLVFPELFTPYPGVYGEITGELSSNSTQFLTTTERRIKNENSDLWNKLGTMLAFLIHDTSLREHSKRWTLTYYEIFSRSARQSGFPMLSVTKENIQISLRFMALDILTNDAFNQSVEYFDKVYSQQKTKIIEDEGQNEELKSFWQDVKHEMALLEENGHPDIEFFQMTSPVLFLSDLLRKQNSEYRLYEQYGLK